MLGASPSAGEVVAVASGGWQGGQGAGGPGWRGGEGGRITDRRGESTAGQGLAVGVPPGQFRAQRSSAGLKRRGVCQQRGENASSAASQPQPGDARSQAAILERPAIPRRQTQEALPLRVVGGKTTQFRPLGLAPDGPVRIGETSVKFWTYG